MMFQKERLNSRIENRTKREMDGFFDWLAGKWFDGFAPSGPWIVTADEIADPHNLEIKLTVNGQTRQQGNTARHDLPHSGANRLHLIDHDA